MRLNESAKPEPRDHLSRIDLLCLQQTVWSKNWHNQPPKNTPTYMNSNISFSETKIEKVILSSECRSTMCVCACTRGLLFLSFNDLKNVIMTIVSLRVFCTVCISAGRKLFELGRSWVSISAATYPSFGGITVVRTC